MDDQTRRLLSCEVAKIGVLGGSPGKDSKGNMLVRQGKEGQAGDFSRDARDSVDVLSDRRDGLIW